LRSHEYRRHKISITIYRFEHHVKKLGGSIFIPLIKRQSGNLVRKPSGGEQAWFLEEESEPRNKWIFLAGENTRADESVCLTVSLSQK
jgi:hypothetical protein